MTAFFWISDEFISKKCSKLKNILFCDESTFWLFTHVNDKIAVNEQTTNYDLLAQFLYLTVGDILFKGCVAPGRHLYRGDKVYKNDNKRR